MSEAKHTPGPWIVPHFALSEPRCDCRYVLCLHYMGAICTVHVNNGIELIADGGNDDPPIEEAKANAHLIAAAPDLLEALKLVVAIADRKTDEFDKARAAIAKAQGKDKQ